MKTSEFLASAQDALESHGWCKGDLRDSQGRLCMIGALHEAYDASGLGSGSSVYHSAIEALEDHIKGFIPVFNDAKDTTLQDVMNVFHKAIASCEERGE